MDSETDGKEEMSPPLKRARLEGQDGTDADDEDWSCGGGICRICSECSNNDRSANVATIGTLTVKVVSNRCHLFSVVAREADLDDEDEDDEEYNASTETSAHQSRESRQDVEDGRLPASQATWTKETLPPPLDHEIEFILKDPTSYKQGQSVYSHSKTLHGCFTFRLLVFPMGTEVTAPPSQLAAFVEASQPPGCEEIRWGFEGVKYQITAVNWKDWRNSDTFNFNRDHSDRGWHKGFVKASLMTSESGWLNDEGELCLRASCSSRRAMQQSSSKKCLGHVGLKNHGATCYMNCLLQTLFCLGAGLNWSQERVSE
eukprot:s2642_g11.t1